MKKVNPIDVLVESLTNAFQTATDTSGLLKSEEVRHIQTTVANGLLTIKGSITIIEDSFLPAVRREITKTKNNIIKSKYHFLLKDTYDQVEDLHFETIRLGYVMSFHKYENYIDNLLNLFDGFYKDSGSLNEYMLKTFSFSIKHWYKNRITHKVNFIANCTKHYDGKFRLKDASKHFPPRALSYLKEGEVINLSIKEYREDINQLLDNCQYVMQILNSCFQLKLFELNKIKVEGELAVQQEQILSYMKNGINTYINVYTM